MKEGLEKTFPNRKIEFISILAQDTENFDGGIAKSFGLNELIKKTANKFKNSIDSISFIYVENQIKNIVENYINDIKIKKNLNNITKSICDFYEKLFGELDENTSRTIKNDVEILRLSCISEINFDEEISNYILNFKKIVNQNGINKNELKNIIDNTEEKLEHQYKLIKSEYQKNNLTSDIFNCYVELLKDTSKTIVNDILKNIKSEVIEKMQKGIKESPTFKKLFLGENFN